MTVEDVHEGAGGAAEEPGHDQALTTDAEEKSAVCRAHRRAYPAPCAQERLVSAVLDDLALLDGDDAIGDAQGGEAVGDQQHRAARADPPHVRLDRRLALVVEGRRGLVEDQDPRVADEARAMAIRWRCPPERDAPRSPIMV